MSLVIDGLWWRYPTFSEKSSPWVLRGIDLEIEPGECFGITGPSGAGKTTLCRAMLGAIPYSSRLTPEQLPQHFRGTITAAGEPVTARTPATNRVGMVLQDPENQFLRMSLLHELGLGLQIQGLP
ncbi:MAG: ATP-binding cassette domain-containing protein, partial [Chloroflexi bacterium]